MKRQIKIRIALSLVAIGCMTTGTLMLLTGQRSSQPSAPRTSGAAQTHNAEPVSLPAVGTQKDQANAAHVGVGNVADRSVATPLPVNEPDGALQSRNRQSPDAFSG